MKSTNLKMESNSVLSTNRRGEGNVIILILLCCLLVVGGVGGWWLLQKPKPYQVPIVKDDIVDPDDVRESITLYCAAGVKPVMSEIVKRYLKEQNINVECQYGGSGTLLDNLQVAKKGDLYLAADNSYIDIAREAGVLEESLPIARIWPVIAVRKGNPKQIKGIEDLLRDDVTFALANPEAASIGKLTKKLLTTSGDWEKISKAVKALKPTVIETAVDVKIGTVDAAILWNTTVVVHKESMDAIQVPFFQKAVKKVTIGVLSFSKNPTEALKFARYLQAPTKGQIDFGKMGYELVSGDKWNVRPSLIIYSGGVNRLAIEQTLKQFSKREGVDLEISYNGCGILVATIKGNQHQPPDVYFACDVSFMTQVQQNFKPALNITETEMVLIVAKGNPKDIKSIHDLPRTGLKIGVANPEQSALGELTRRLFLSIKTKESNLHKEVLPNIVTLQPTADILVNQLLTGALDAAIVYLANVSEVKEKLEVVTIKQGNPTATQPIAVHKASKYPYLAQRLVDALTSNQSQERFLIHGFKWRLSK